MVDSNSHIDEPDQHMMGDYSHVGDESVQYTERDSISLDDLSSHPQGDSNRDSRTDHPSENLQQPPDTTDQQLIDEFPYVDNDIRHEDVRRNPYNNEDINRFLRPFGTNPRQEEDSYSAIMRQWNEEREKQESQKNEVVKTAQEINIERTAVGLYHKVPGDFAETLIFYDPFTFNSIVDEYMETILSNVDNRSVDEWLTILKRFNEYHKDDNLIPRSHRTFLKRLEDGPFDYMTQSDWELLVKVEGFMYYEWSVYPDVRAVTVPIDEENDEDYETFRVYAIGIGWAVGGCILHTMFEPMYPTVFDVTLFQMLVSITGHIWAFLPRISIPFTWYKKIVLNNGRSWSFREQMLASVAISVSLRYPYAQDLIIALSNNHMFSIQGAANFGFILLLILSTQFMGFAIAGLQRAFFVYPSRMVYFDTLFINSVNRALVVREPREKVNGWVLKRWEFFYHFTFILFGWFWVVNVAFTALYDFDWPTWISPNNINLNAITGTYSGLGIFPFSTLDPQVMEFTSLYTPWNALWQYTAGFLVSTIVIIIIWYTNTANTAYLPINVNLKYDNTGSVYNSSRIMNSDNTLNLEAYEDYSPIFYGATALVARGITYMYFPAQLVSCGLNYWRDFVLSCKAFRMIFRLKKDENFLEVFDDRFSRTASSHPGAPGWWFIVIFFVCFGVAIAIVEHWNFVETPVYSIALSCGIAAIYIYPMESLRSRTTYGFDMKPLLQLINGMIFKTNPIGFMTSTLYGTSLSSQSSNYIDNLKMGHYAGIAPRSLFRCQALSLLLCSILQAGIVQWQASDKITSDFCSNSPQSKTRLTCPAAYVRSEDAILLSALSPKRIFHDYPYLKWTFLIGALYPLPLWIFRQLMPHSMRFISKLIVNSDTLVVLDEMVWLNSGLSWIPWMTWQYVGSNFIVGVLWHKWIRPCYPQWFSKYTYLFLGCMQVAISFGNLIYTLVEDNLSSLNLSWWGNNVNSHTMDKKSTAVRLPIPPKGYFGPDRGDFPGKV